MLIRDNPATHIWPICTYICRASVSAVVASCAMAGVSFVSGKAPERIVLVPVPPVVQQAEGASSGTGDKRATPSSRKKPASPRSAGEAKSAEAGRPTGTAPEDLAQPTTLRQPDYDRLSKILNDIGQAVVDELGDLPNHAFLFVQITDRWSNVKLYVDRGKVVQLIEPDGALPKLAIRLWRVDNMKRPKALRWVYFEYDLRKRKVSAEFVYPEKIADDVSVDQWIEQSLRKRFRKKPVVAEDVPLNDDAPRS